MSDNDKPMSAECAAAYFRDNLAILQDGAERYNSMKTVEISNLISAHKEAIAALREKAARENPEPLANDEESLLARCGSPIWHVRSSGETKCGIPFWQDRGCAAGFAVAFDYGWEWLRDVLGTGTIYAHKPGGEGAE